MVNDQVARDRLRIETIKSAATKLKPRVYGEKLTTDVNMKNEDARSPEFLEMVRRLNQYAATSA